MGSVVKKTRSWPVVQTNIVLLLTLTSWLCTGPCTIFLAGPEEVADKSILRITFQNYSTLICKGISISDAISRYTWVATANNQKQFLCICRQEKSSPSQSQLPSGRIGLYLRNATKLIFLVGTTRAESTAFRRILIGQIGGEQQVLFTSTFTNC